MWFSDSSISTIQFIWASRLAKNTFLGDNHNSTDLPRTQQAAWPRHDKRLHAQDQQISISQVLLCCRARGVSCRLLTVLSLARPRSRADRVSYYSWVTAFTCRAHKFPMQGRSSNRVVSCFFVHVFLVPFDPARATDTTGVHSFFTVCTFLSVCLLLVCCKWAGRLWYRLWFLDGGKEDTWFGSGDRGTQKIGIDIDGDRWIGRQFHWQWSSGSSTKQPRHYREQHPTDWRRRIWPKIKDQSVEHAVSFLGCMWWSWCFCVALRAHINLQIIWSDCDGPLTHLVRLIHWRDDHLLSWGAAEMQICGSGCTVGAPFFSKVFCNTLR